MTLWIVLALMTGAAVLLVLWPLARQRVAATEGGGDAAVYRDQIDEIWRDRDRGLIGDRDAESARAEVARRLFAASERAERPAAGDPRAADRRRRIAAVIALVAVPGVALGVYGALGRPDAPDRPLSARLNGPVDTGNLQEMVTRVEAELARNPNDGRGWLVLAPVYLRLGRNGDAADAYGAAIRLLGSSAELEANRGEALAADADGVIGPEARAAFERAVKADPLSPKGVIYLARAREQDEDIAGALALLKPLLAHAGAGSPLAEPLRGELQRLAAPPPLAMPTPEQAGAAKTPEERMAMVRGMVDRLAQRVESGDAHEIGEWLRLVQSRAVLGEADKAKAALATARQRFAGDPRAAARLEALALGLGLEGGGA